MLQNKSRVYIANFSGVDASKGDTTTTTTKPVMTVVATKFTPKPVATTTTTSRPPTTTTTTTPPPVAIPPAVVIAPPPASLGGGGAGGGGGEEKTGETAGAGATGGGGHMMEIIGFSSFAFVAGAVAGYFVGKKMEKNKWLFAGIGGVALGLATYGVTTKFVYPSDVQQTSGFLGFGKRSKKQNKAKVNNTPDWEGHCKCGNQNVWAKECCNK